MNNNKTLDIRSSGVIINGSLIPSDGNLQVQGNLIVNGSLTSMNLISNIEYENITFSNVINVKNVYVSGNLTTLPGCTVRIESELQISGNISSQNFTSNVLRITNLENSLVSNAIRLSNLEASNVNIWSNISSNSIRLSNLESRILANTLLQTTFANTFQTASTVNIDANLYTFYTHFGALPSGTVTVQISNLISGKQVNAFFRNIGPTNTPTVTVTTSPGTTGYVAPFMSRHGTAGAAATNISPTLAINGGCVLFMVANVSSNVCGYFI